MSKKSRVVLLPCETYDEEAVYRCLKQGIGLLGGVEALFGKEEKILLKPNLLKRAEVEKAVTTHPAVVGAFARLLTEAGRTKLRFGDSCGVGTTARVIAGTGMDEALDCYGVEICDFSKGERVSYPEGHQAKEFVLAKEVLEADAVVSLSKMKTHALERITGAVKNSYGFVQGLHKAKGHPKYPTADSFARMLIDLNNCVKPRLYLMDGITAMEGNGPGSGDPVEMKVLLLGTDPVALDTVFCRLIHLDPKLVPTNVHGEKLGLGTCREEEIELLTPDGEISCSEAAKRWGKADFRVERGRGGSAGWVRLVGIFKNFQKKPYIAEDACIRCGICVESCPVEGKALSFRNGKEKAPVYDYKKCIRCFCCQEMCPKKAIRVRGMR